MTPFLRHLPSGNAFTQYNAGGFRSAPRKRKCLRRKPAPRGVAAIRINARIKQSNQAAELFLTATPNESRSPQEQATRLFSAVADALRSRSARVLQERVLGTDEALAAAMPVRAQVYGDLDDGVPPVLLRVPEGPAGAISGVQMHAVTGGQSPRVIAADGAPCGRIVGMPSGDYLALSGLVAPEAGSNAAQARAIFERAASLLQQAGGDMLSVARTWLWLESILDWYDEFNDVRSAFFRDCGLIKEHAEETHLPASTGIGVGPVGEAACALDVVAVIGGNAPQEYFHAAGMQHCAYEYGSAFSRAARTATPAGDTVYVSGTAAIDEAGATQHVGDARGQIAMTLVNVRAVLADLGCADGDVVHALAYSKTPEVEAVFRQEFAALDWPCISVIGDICRDDLLFEVEAAACPGAKPL